MKGFNIGLVEGIDVSRSLAVMVKKSMNILAAFKMKVSACDASGKSKSLISDRRETDPEGAKDRVIRET